MAVVQIAITGSTGLIGKALVRASQICIGHKNDLGIAISGTKGTLRWRQEEPEAITIHLANQPDRVYWRGAVHPGERWAFTVRLRRPQYPVARLWRCGPPARRGHAGSETVRRDGDLRPASS